MAIRLSHIYGIILLEKRLFSEKLLHAQLLYTNFVILQLMKISTPIKILQTYT